VIESEVTETDRCYAAGFFDADGYVGVIQYQTGVNATYYALRCTITNNNLEILEHFRTKFGGSIHSKDNKLDVWLHQYNLMWNAQNCKDFISQILPYLRVKKQQAEIAMMYPLNETREYKSQALTEQRWKIYEALKQLKHTKNPIPEEYVKGIAVQEHSEYLRKKQQTVDLRKAHPDWSIRQIATEMKVSSTMVHKYLKTAGATTKKEGYGEGVLGKLVYKYRKPT
jgi:LAGLIDADG DNA endonuclease family protein